MFETILVLAGCDKEEINKEHGGSDEMTDIKPNGPAWPISEDLAAILQDAVRECAGSALVIFSEPMHAIVKGHVRPVEIMVGKTGDIGYITSDICFDFAGGCQSALNFDPPSASKIDPPQVVVFSC